MSNVNVVPIVLRYIGFLFLFFDLAATMWVAHGEIRRRALLFFLTSSIVNISDFLSAVSILNLLRAFEPLTVVLCQILQFVTRDRFHNDHSTLVRLFILTVICDNLLGSCYRIQQGRTGSYRIMPELCYALAVANRFLGIFSPIL